MHDQGLEGCTLTMLISDASQSELWKRETNALVFCVTVTCVLPQPGDDISLRPLPTKLPSTVNRCMDNAFICSLTKGNKCVDF